MPSIGIDLGTTNCAAAVVEGGDPEIIDIDNRRLMRSVLTFANIVENEEEAAIVGDEAITYLMTNADLSVSSVKRKMGRDWSKSIRGMDTEFTPEMISGLLLKKVAQEAKQHRAVGGDIDGVVITVPARFTQIQRECTRAAAGFAYLDTVYMLLGEPSAACVAYEIDSGEQDAEKVAVYDFGGGTFDFSIVDVVADDLGETEYHVSATEGDERLGGDDIDEAIIEWMFEELSSTGEVDIEAVRNDDDVMGTIKEDAKNAKERLTKGESTTLNHPPLKGLPDGYNLTLTRETFEKETRDLIERTITICEEVLERKHFSPDDIEKVLLVGGSSKIPAVKMRVKELFGEEKIVTGVNPDLAVAEGAGLQAERLANQAQLAAQQEDEVGGELAVAEGGVFEAAPDDIGFRLADGSFEVLIEEDDNFPAENTGMGYTTTRDNQPSADIKIYQGDSEIAEENQHIMTFTLDGIHPAPKGEPDISVRFRIDQSGLLAASAWEVGEDGDPEAEAEAEHNLGGQMSAGADTYYPPSLEEVKELRDQLPPVK